MNTPEHRMADALRLVALRLDHARESGHRSSRIDAHDLLETLLAVADELDSATPADNKPTVWQPVPPRRPTFTACGCFLMGALVVSPPWRHFCVGCAGERLS
jgi:hypothetical protein